MFYPKKLLKLQFLVYIQQKKRPKNRVNSTFFGHLKSYLMKEKAEIFASTFTACLSDAGYKYGAAVKYYSLTTGLVCGTIKCNLVVSRLYHCVFLFHNPLLFCINDDIVFCSIVILFWRAMTKIKYSYLE